MSPSIRERMVWRPEYERILDEWKRRYDRTEVEGVCLEPFGEDTVYFRYSDPVTHPVYLRELHAIDDAGNKQEMIETAARALVTAAKKKYWEGLGDELKTLADALGERFPI